MIILQIRNLWFKKKWEKNVSSVLQSAVFKAKIQIFSKSKLARFDLQQAGRRDKIVKSSKRCAGRRQKLPEDPEQYIAGFDTSLVFLLLF